MSITLSFSVCVYVSREVCCDLVWGDINIRQLLGDCICGSISTIGFPSLIEIEDVIRLYSCLLISINICNAEIVFPNGLRATIRLWNHVLFAAARETKSSAIGSLN